MKGSVRLRVSTVRVSVRLVVCTARGLHGEWHWTVRGAVRLGGLYRSNSHGAVVVVIVVVVVVVVVIVMVMLLQLLLLLHLQVPAPPGVLHSFFTEMTRYNGDVVSSLIVGGARITASM